MKSYISELLSNCNIYYKIALDQIPGGKADNSKKHFDPKQLEQGVEIEMEHTDDPEIAKEITKDHLTEFDDYYSGLKKMEKDLEKND
jgi:hypothetical protein